MTLWAFAAFQTNGRRHPARPGRRLVDDYLEKGPVRRASQSSACL